MESFRAEIYDNTIENCKYGIRLSVGSADNDIHDNTFDSSSTCEERLHVQLPSCRLQHVLWEGALNPNPRDTSVPVYLARLVGASLQQDGEAVARTMMPAVCDARLLLCSLCVKEKRAMCALPLVWLLASSVCDVLVACSC